MSSYACNTSYFAGRLLLGSRVLSFRTRPRSTLRRPHTHLTAVVLPTSRNGRTPILRAGPMPKPAPANAAVVFLQSREHRPTSTDKGGKNEELQDLALQAESTACGAKACQGDEGYSTGTNRGGTASLGAAVGTAIASTCKRPTVSTSTRSALDSLNGCSHQRLAGHTEEAAPGERPYVFSIVACGSYCCHLCCHLHIAGPGYALATWPSFFQAHVSSIPARCR